MVESRLSTLKSPIASCHLIKLEMLGDAIIVLSMACKILISEKGSESSK